MANEGERNPIVLPGVEPKRRGCPLCGFADFSGRKVDGVVTYTCKSPECKNQWQGGLPQYQEDPSNPAPTTNYVPEVQFMNVYGRDGSIVKTEEVRRRVNSTQSFRRGALIPDGEDY